MSKTYKRIIVDVPIEVHDRIKEVKRREGLTMVSLIEHALESVYTNYEKKQTKSEVTNGNKKSF